MIPGAWNSQREVGNVQNIPGPIEGALEKKMMITGGWNSWRKANITLQDPGHVDDAMKEKRMIEQAEGGQPTQQDPGHMKALWRKR